MPGSIIKSLREKTGLRQGEIAEQMGISQSAYSKLENGQTELTLKHCKLLSKILGVNVYDYFPDDFEIVRRKVKKDDEVSDL